MGTLVCTVEMDKTAGTTVTVDNADDSITQTIVMNGTSIVITVKGSSDTSTYTQTAEKVAVVCKQFEVTASETITMTSTKGSTYESQDVLTVKSAKDMTVSSDADINASATNIKATGSSKVSLSGGGQSTLDLASSSAALASIKVEATGQSEVAVSGPQVNIKADATLNAESSGIATLKGSVTNVQGSLVNLG